MKNFITWTLALNLLFLTNNYVSAEPSKSMATYTPTLSVEDFLAEQNIGDAEMSPNGRYLALIWIKNKERHLIIKDLGTEGSPIIGKLGELTFRPYQLKWANDKRLLVQFLVPRDQRRVLRNSKHQDDFDIYDYAMTNLLLSVDVNAKNPVLMMEKRHISSFVSHYLPDDPNHVLMPYSSKGQYSLDKVNVYTGESEVQVRGGSRTYKILTDGIGKPLFRLDYLRHANARIVFRYNEENEWDEIKRVEFEKTSEEENNDQQDSQVVSFGLTENSTIVYRQRNKLTGFFELVELDEQGGNKKVIASLPDQDIVGLINDTRSNRLIGFT